jgi:hypothetical protein
MARKYSAYTDAPLYRKIQNNIRQFLDENFPLASNAADDENFPKESNATVDEKM